MSEVSGNTPVIIGAGQYSERLDEPHYAGLSYADLAGRALEKAIADCGASGSLAGAIDTLAHIRAFEMSRPDRTPPFGAPDNVPRAVARRVGAEPRRAILSPTGGQTNQQMVGEFAQDIARGACECAVITGAEAISTVRALMEKGEAPDWSEEIGGDLEDRGYGLDDLLEPVLFAHGATGAIPLYALAENARRARLGMGLEDYRCEIGELFAPFTRIAAANPHAAAPVERSAQELASVSERNRIVAEPYTRMTVARDQVNQAAAIIIASAGKARALGVPEEKWVHIHAVTAAGELPLLRRPDLSACPASIASVERALRIAGKAMSEMTFLDFYSCFAIPVFNQIDHFGLSPDDPRGLTLTGGLPFFGGAGNNYSAHAIAEAVERVRSARGSYALVGANGGWMSKYATGIYSTEPADWSGDGRVEAIARAQDDVSLARELWGMVVLETYTLVPGKAGEQAILIASTDAGERICANADLAHPATAALIRGGMPFGARLAIEADAAGRYVARLPA